MAFDVSTFRSSVFGSGSSGVAKQSHFELVMGLPRDIFLSTRSRRAYNGLRFRVETAELPGRSIQTTNYKHLGYGLTSKVGYDVTYQDISISVLCSADLGEKAFFQAWQSSVIGNHSRNPETRPHQSIGYYDNYVAPIGIVQYDENGVATYAMALTEAYPITVNSMPLNWGGEDLHRLTVQFAYKHFTESDEPPAGRGARINSYGVSLTVNSGENTLDDKFEGLGLPRLGEIFNIPLFETNSITLTGASDIGNLFP